MRAIPLVLLMAASGAVAQTTHTVTVRSFQFTPATLSIEAGDTVRWVNEEGFHNLHQLSGSEAFGQLTVSSGWEYEFTFTQVGTSTYQCDPHSGSMQGSITVTPTTSTEAPSEGAARLDLTSENPFTGSVRLSLVLPQPETVRVAVYDARGREVDVIFDGQAIVGETSLVWASGAARPGIYVVRAVAPSIALSQGVSLAGTPDHSGGQ